MDKEHSELMKALQKAMPVTPLPNKPTYAEVLRYERAAEQRRLMKELGLI
jgi:hypothetical protein